MNAYTYGMFFCCPFHDGMRGSEPVSSVRYSRSFGWLTGRANVRGVGTTGNVYCVTQQTVSAAQRSSQSRQCKKADNVCLTTQATMSAMYHSR